MTDNMHTGYYVLEPMEKKEGRMTFDVRLRNAKPREAYQYGATREEVFMTIRDRNFKPRDVWGRMVGEAFVFPA